MYFIVNLENYKVYIGIASRSFSSRWAHHRRRLRNGNHHSIHLQSAWNKYGEESFEFIVYERCPPEQCLEREQFWIDYYESYERENGYNTCRFAGNTLGVKHREETKARMKESAKKRVETTDELSRLLELSRSAKEKPGYKERQSAIKKQQWKTPEYRDRLVKSHRKQWKDQEYRTKVLKAQRNARILKKLKKLTEATSG